MATETKIQWCDHSASPWYGCQHAMTALDMPHPGCEHCYAEALAKRNPRTLGVWGESGTRVISKSFARNCRLWNRQAETAGVRASVFPSLCDPFEDWEGIIHESNGDQVFVSDEGRLGDFPGGRPATMDDLRRELFALIDSCDWLDFLLLTKRPQHVRSMWPAKPGVPTAADWRITGDAGGLRMENCAFRENVWLITSVSDQPTADVMIPELLKCRGLVPVLGISAEPLLGPINITRLDEQNGLASPGVDGLDWVIVGGESGPHARPCEVEWIRSIVQQCRAASVPVFVKQLGARPEIIDDRVKNMRGDSVGTCSLRLKDAKGGDPAEWPEYLRVREFPKASA